MYSKKSISERINSWFFYYSEELIVFSLVVFFLLEAINKTFFFLNKGALFSISFYVKIFLQFLFIVPIFLNYAQQAFFNKLLVWFSFCLLFLGVIKFNNNDFLTLLWGLKHFNKLVLFFFVYCFLDIFKPNLQIVLKWFDWIYVIASIIILIGFSFQIEYFKSYPFTDRFGYSGVFNRNAINDVSFFYLIGCYYAFYRWQNNEISIFVFFTVLFSSFLVGTKAIYLQNILLVIYVVLMDRRRRLIVLTVVTTLFIFLIVIYNFDFWTELLYEKGLIAVLTSNRSELLIENFPNLAKDFSISSLLFGYPNPFQYFIEMDLFDLFLSLGLLSGGILIALYIKILFNFHRGHLFAWFFTGVFALMASISGRYSYSGLNAIYFPLFLYYLRVSFDETHLVENE